MNYTYTVINGALCLFGKYKDEEHFAFFPEGCATEQELHDCIRKIRTRFDITFLHPLNKEQAELLGHLFPGSEIKCDRSLFDYVYSASELISLSGRKFHQKRNHVNFFKSTFPYQYHSITAAADKLSLLRRAAETLFTETDNEELSDEYQAIGELISNFAGLNLTAGVITVDGMPVAYSIGELYNGDTALIHIEKADKSFDGAFAVINNEFLKQEFPHAVYVNREEDMDIAGLRKAKLSYHPVKFNEVYKIKLCI